MKFDVMIEILLKEYADNRSISFSSVIEQIGFNVQVDISVEF